MNYEDKCIFTLSFIFQIQIFNINFEKRRLKSILLQQKQQQYKTHREMIELNFYSVNE